MNRLAYFAAAWVLGFTTLSALIAEAAITDPPQTVSPADGAAIPNLGPTLEWSTPPGATQYQLQVTPAKNDGPGINLILGSAHPSTGSGQAETFAIPAPPSWYGLLPGMTYTWRVRASDATSGLGEGDADWGPWSEGSRFRTPGASSGDITLNTRGQVSGRTPTLTWSNRDPAIYYYEVQVSRDQGFGPGSFLYWELRHGGVTSPRNSYTVPSQYPLEQGATYHWRVRPRVQGDGTAVEWTPAGSFTTEMAASPGSLLQISSPADESSVTTATVQVTGRYRPGAIVTINEAIAFADASGNFRATVSLQPGPNELEIIATDMEGNTARTSITVTYVTP